MDLKTLLWDSESYFFDKPYGKRTLLRPLIILFRILFYGSLLFGRMRICVKLDRWGYNNGYLSLGSNLCLIPLIIFVLYFGIKVVEEKGLVYFIFLIIFIVIVLALLSSHEAETPLRIHRIRFRF